VRSLVLPLALVAALALGCNALERVPEGDVDASQRAAAERIAAKIYEACRDGHIEPLTAAEASPEMRQGMSVEKMRTSCDGITKMFGTYVSMDYAETWRPRGTSLFVYRFKGHFSKGGQTPEIRVVMDGDKLSGFWLKPWADRPR
jgi:hypothetical protein